MKKRYIKPMVNKCSKSLQAVTAGGSSTIAIP
jgi:hypothetical protein